MNASALIHVNTFMYWHDHYDDKKMYISFSSRATGCAIFDTIYGRKQQHGTAKTVCILLFMNSRSVEFLLIVLASCQSADQNHNK